MLVRNVTFENAAQNAVGKWQSKNDRTEMLKKICGRESYPQASQNRGQRRTLLKYWSKINQMKLLPKTVEKSHWKKDLLDMSVENMP